VKNSSCPQIKKFLGCPMTDYCFLVCPKLRPALFIDKNGFSRIKREELTNIGFN
jgi:hypothetical protein